MKLIVQQELGEITIPELVNFVKANGIEATAQYSGILNVLKDHSESRHVIMAQVFGFTGNTLERHIFYAELGRIAAAWRDHGSNVTIA